MVTQQEKEDVSEAILLYAVTNLKRAEDFNQTIDMFKEILPTLQEVNPKWNTLPKNEVSTKFKLHQNYIDYFRK